MLIRRDSYLRRLRKAKDANVIKVISGLRRSGKSTLLQMFRDELHKGGVEQSRLQTYNFENPVHGDKNYLELYDEIVANLQPNCQNYVFLDEIQNIDQFEKLVDGLFIIDNVDLYVTGSNAYFLSGEFATLLSGRYIEIKVLPLSFAEYVSAFSDGATSHERLFDQYIHLGSLPEVANLLRRNQKDLVDDYLLGIYNTVISKDVLTRTGTVDVLVLQDIARYLADNVGNFTTVKKITDTLKSSSRPSAYNTIDKYLNALRESLIFYPVDRYDIKGKKYLQTQQKYYLVDTGLRKTILGSGQGDDRGHLLENVVYLELLRRGNRVWVGKQGDKEIDFVVRTKNGDTEYYQVAYSTASPDVYEREFAPLKQLDDSYRKYVITMDIGSVNDVGIKQLNAIDWLLAERQVHI